MKKVFFILLLTQFSFISLAQLEKQIVLPPYYIKTVKLDNGKKPKPAAIISLRERIFLSFDDLQADEKEYQYRIKRFDENWQLSNLNESEYIDGFATDYITDITQSSGTLQSYTHYSAQIPNENTRILLTGNYIAEILNEDEEVIFSKPFIVYSQNINVGMQVKWPIDISLKDHMQFIEFSLYKTGYNIINETESLTVKIFQNNDIGYALSFHQPTFYKGEEWVYHYPHEALFEGINEFRRFETKDLRGYNYGISHKELNELYDFYPYTGNFRYKYSYYKDIDGAYILNSTQAPEDVNTEADYVNVHFSFNGILEPDESLYVIGQFNDFSPTPNYQLNFNAETQRYEATILLKQGYYDYMFVTKNKQNQIDIAAIEGSFAQTENEYTIIVYYHPPGARYTKVIGYGHTSSEQIN